eukprot:2509112-Amphidinium_carterae.1
MLGCCLGLVGWLTASPCERLHPVVLIDALQVPVFTSLYFVDTADSTQCLPLGPGWLSTVFFHLVQDGKRYGLILQRLDVGDAVELGIVNVGVVVLLTSLGSCLSLLVIAQRADAVSTLWCTCWRAASQTSVALASVSTQWCSPSRAACYTVCREEVGRDLDRLHVLSLPFS